MNTKFPSAAISANYYMNQPQYTVFQSFCKYLPYRNQNDKKYTCFNFRRPTVRA